jgi:hypothetical protein
MLRLILVASASTAGTADALFGRARSTPAAGTGVPEVVARALMSNCGRI